MSDKERCSEFSIEWSSRHLFALIAKLSVDVTCLMRQGYLGFAR